MVDEKYIIDGYYPTIGIECHVQLKTKTKLFASVSNEAREAKPNTLVSHICFGLPGALPVLNEEAVRLSAKAAYALGTKPQAFSKFDRKHYFYPDLPKGYQISQFDKPIILNGKIDIVLEDGTTKTVNITRAHIEEDAGKSTHPAGADFSLVDLNRAGTPLLEIVSEPEIHSAEEAKAYAKELWLRMKYAGVSDVDLYHGNMRFDVNVSVSKDRSTLGTRSETKNLNSFKSVERAVTYEIKRQIELLERGEAVVQETRGWLDDKQKTVSQRSKENAHDYRYFPDPDIPPLELDEAYISEIEDELPIMPDEIREKLSQSGIAKNVIEDLLPNQLSVHAVMKVLKESGQHAAKRIALLFLQAQTKLDESVTKGETIAFSEAFPVSHFSELAAMAEASEVNSNAAQEIFWEMLRSGEQPRVIAEKNNLLQVNDAGELEIIIDTVIADNPKPVAEVQAGEVKVIGYLVGQVMKMSHGKANPAEAQKILRSKLGL